MGVDLGKIAASAIEAALDDGENSKPKRKSGSTVKAVVAGAALAVAAKAATSKRTKLMSKLVPTPSLGGLRDIPGRVRDRLADSGLLGDEADVVPEDGGPLDEVTQEEPLEDEDEEPVDEDEEDFDEEEGDDEPVDEEDEDFDEEEEEDEPLDEEDEDFDEEEGDEDLDEEEEDEDFDEEEEEDSPPELAIDSDDDEDIDPVTRPPKPPKATSRR